MDIAMLRAFFMWCTIINGALFLLAASTLAFAPDLLYRAQRKCFPIARESYTVLMYSFLGVFKIFLLVFNVVPYVALLIVR